MTVLDDPGLVAHGYTMHDVDRLAHYAVRRFRAGRIAGFEEYVDHARAAIEDRLLEAVEPPSESELLRAAGRGIYAFTYEWEKEHGWDHKALNFRPGFERYWTWRPPQPEDAVIDRLAVRQILPTLTPAQANALLLLALFDGDGRRAADVLGISYSAFRMRIKTARDRFQSYWYAPETPPSRAVWRVSNSATHMRTNGLKSTCQRWHSSGCRCWEDAPAEDDGTCSREGCDKPRRKKGLCYGHHQEQWQATQVPVEGETPSCSRQGCSEAPEKRGMCLTHYRRLVRGS